MAQAFNAQLPQPNFGRIAQMHVELSTELEKCQNIPAVHQGNEILQALQQLQNQLQTRFDQMQDNITSLRNEVGDLRGEINTIKTRLSAVDANNVARVINSRITRPDHDLTPLVGVLTNEPIPNAPQDAEAIRTMSAASVNAFLQSLDQSTEGTLAAKRRRIRAAFGLLPEPV